MLMGSCVEVVGARALGVWRFSFFFSSRRRHTRCSRDWSSDCALPISGCAPRGPPPPAPGPRRARRRAPADPDAPPPPAGARWRAAAPPSATCERRGRRRGATAGSGWCSRAVSRPERATQPCTVVPFFPLSRPRRGRVLGHGQDTKWRRRNEISPSPMTQYLILRDLAVIFAVSLLVILLFHRLKLPALPGFIVAGVLLGPNALGLVSDVHQVESLAEVGVILLLFTIGIEFSLGRLREMGRQVVVGGLSQVGLTVAASALVARASGTSWQIALLLGFLVALSSTALVLKGLTDKGEIDAPHGRLATGVLIFQDLCVVPMMLVLPFLAGRAAGGPSGLLLALGKAVLVVIGVLVVARTVVPRALAEILKTRSRELFLIAIILLGTLTALGTAAAGASLALGAFLAGLVISESDYGHQAMAELLPFRDVFISLFFVAGGMLVPGAVLRGHPPPALGGGGGGLGGEALLAAAGPRSEEHTSELQSRLHLVCRLLLEKKKISLTHPTAAVCATTD